MKKLAYTLLVLLFLTACSGGKNEKITYPVTAKGNVVDTIFGTPVPDPYRWLEDDMSDETAAWVKEQNLVTFAYLEKIPYRDKIKERLTNIYNYEKYGMPHREGEFIYFSKNDGLQNQYVLYRHMEGEDPEVFLDPNKFSADGTTSLREMG
ncbi:MAG: S9 family peptidase, partial [Planctomycetaceae bacterium]